MDNQFRSQKNTDSEQKYRIKAALVLTAAVVLVALILGGLIKVIADEKKIKNNIGNGIGELPTVTQGAESQENGTESNGSGSDGNTMPGESGGESGDINNSTATDTPSGPKVVIDAGHGGTDYGSVKNELQEKDANLAIALYLQEILKDLGYEVYMIRSDDSSVENRTRTELAAEQGGDIYVSIHQNSLDQDSDATMGCEVWYSDSRNNGSDALSQYVVDALAEATGARNRGIKVNNNWTVLKYTEMPACLVECGFMSSETERANLFAPEYQKKIAQGIADGIVKFLPIEQ